MMSPELKDKVLEYIVVNSPNLRMQSSLEEFAKEFQISNNVVEAILRQFDKKGLINFNPFIGGGFYLEISADAHDYLFKGGYLGEYQYLEMQVQKLKNDLYSFESSIPKDKFDNLINTTNVILTAASAFHTVT